MGNGHARLSPSNHRWVHCPGSIREEAVYPDSSGDAAVDGTGSHLLLEIAGRTGRAEEWLDRTIGEGHEDREQGWWVKQDRCDRVQMALDYIARRRTEMTIHSIEYEVSSDPGHYVCGRTDWKGTVDIVIRGVAPCGTKIIEVIDYKDGRMFVSEKDNPQLIAYAAGRLGPFMADEYLIRMTIIQPKTNVPVRYQDMSSPLLWEKAKKLAVAAARTDDPNAPLVAGDWCTWCKHGRAGACTAKSEIAMEGVSLMTSADGNSSMVEAIQSGQITPAGMPGEQIAAIMDASKAIKKMIEQVEEEAMKRLEAGEDVPGYAIGTGNGKRVWNNEEEVVEKKLKGFRLKKGDIYPAKMISPAAAEKLLNPKQVVKMQDMVTTVAGKKKVVKSDKVKVEKSVDDMFGAIPEKTEAPAPMSFM